MNLIFLALGSLLVGVAGSLLARRNSLRVQISLVTQAIAVALVLWAVAPVLVSGGVIEAFLPWSYPIEQVHFQVDAVSAFFLAFSLPMTFLGSLYAVGYLAPYFEKKRHAGFHFALLNLVSVSFILIYAVHNLLIFLLGWEIAALAAWLLVIWEYKNQKIRFAGFNYLVSTHLGLLFLVAAFLLLHSQTGAFDFSDFRLFLRAPSPLRATIFVLLMTSFGLKSAFFPFHTWLPRAHAAAPAHVSALMSGVIHKAGIYGMLRFTLLMETPEQWMGWYLVAFSTLSAFMGVLYTVSQRDIKRLLGYSSTENVGIAGIGIGVGILGLHFQKPALVSLGFAVAMLHVLNHAFFKCLLFYAAGAIYRTTQTIDLERLGGLIRKMPQTSVFFLIGGLAISALPPFNGFVSEFLLYSALFSHQIPDAMGGAFWVMEGALLAFIGGISALAMARVFGIAFLGVPRDPRIQCTGEAPLSMRFGMAVHTAGVLVLGLFPFVGLRLVQRGTEEFVRFSGEAVPVSETLGASYALLRPITYLSAALVAVTFGLWMLRRVVLGISSRRHCTWGCGYLAGNPRMQYTGSSFSDSFARSFRGVLRFLRKTTLPEGPFPKEASINTHCVDSVERRLFKVIGNGEDWFVRMAVILKEDPAFSFALGLALFLGAIGLVLIS